MYEMVYVVTNVFFIYTIYKFMRVFFNKPTTSVNMEFLSYVLFYILITSIYLLLPIALVIASINIFSYYLLTFNYEATQKQRLSAVALIYFVLMGVESFFVLLSRSSVLTLMSGSYYESSMGLILVRIISFVFVHIFANFKSIKRGRAISISYWFCIIFIPTASLVIIFMSTDYLADARLQMLILIIILLTINFAVFFLYDAVSQNAENLLQKSLLEQQNKYYAQQFDLIKVSLSTMSTFKHDLKNHLSSINSLVSSGDNVAALAHLLQMQEVCSPTKKYANSFNPAVDSVLNFKIAEAEQYDIDVMLDLSITPELAIPSFDLTVILGNLIDNAIYVSKALVENRYIKIDMKLAKGRLIIRIENPYDLATKEEGKKYLTTKHSSEGHGLGIESVQSVISRFDGAMEIEHENNIFIVQLMLYLQ